MYKVVNSLKIWFILVKFQFWGLSGFKLEHEARIQQHFYPVYWIDGFGSSQISNKILQSVCNSWQCEVSDSISDMLNPQWTTFMFGLINIWLLSVSRVTIILFPKFNSLSQTKCCYSFNPWIITLCQLKLSPTTPAKYFTLGKYLRISNSLKANLLK